MWGSVLEFTHKRHLKPELLLKANAQGYEESLYVKADGKYFLYTNGGEDSIYKTENIARMSAAKAQQWLEEHKA